MPQTLVLKRASLSIHSTPGQGLPVGVPLQWPRYPALKIKGRRAVSIPFRSTIGGRAVSQHSAARVRLTRPLHLALRADQAEHCTRGRFAGLLPAFAASASLRPPPSCSVSSPDQLRGNPPFTQKGLDGIMHVKSLFLQRLRLGRTGR